MTLRTVIKYAGEVVSDDSVGAVAWADPEHAQGAPGDDYASAAGPGQTEYLVARDFDLGIPGTAQPRQGRFRIDRRSGKPALQEIVHVSGGVITNISNGTTATVPVPNGLQPGDVVTIFIGWSNGAGVSFSATPAGFISGPASAYSGSPSGMLYSWWKVVGDPESEPDDWVWTWGGSRSTIRVAWDVWRNVDPDVLASTTSQNNAESSTYGTSAGVTVSAAEGLLLVATWWNNSSPGAITPIPGMDVVHDYTSGGVGLFLHSELVATGATGARQSTTANSVRNFNVAFALLPALGLDPGTGAEDKALRLVLDGAVQSDELAIAGAWDGDEYREDETGLIDFSDVAVADLNATGSGVALSAEVDADIEARVRAVEWWLQYDIAVDVTWVTPSSPGAALAWASGPFEITVAIDGDPVTLAAARWRIYRDAELTQLVYDSGVVDGSLTHSPAGGTPAVAWRDARQGVPYWVQVQVIEDGGFDGGAIEGTASRAFSIDGDMPIVASLAVEPVTEEEA